MIKLLRELTVQMFAQMVAAFIAAGPVWLIWTYNDFHKVVNSSITPTYFQTVQLIFLVIYLLGIFLANVRTGLKGK